MWTKNGKILFQKVNFFLSKIFLQTKNKFLSIVPERESKFLRRKGKIFNNFLLHFFDDETSLSKKKRSTFFVSQIEKIHSTEIFGKWRDDFWGGESRKKGGQRGGKKERIFFRLGVSLNSKIHNTWYLPLEKKKVLLRAIFSSLSSQQLEVEIGALLGWNFSFRLLC